MANRSTELVVLYTYHTLKICEKQQQKQILSFKMVFRIKSVTIQTKQTTINMKQDMVHYDNGCKFSLTNFLYFESAAL